MICSNLFLLNLKYFVICLVIYSLTQRLLRYFWICPLFCLWISNSLKTVLLFSEHIHCNIVILSKMYIFLDRTWTKLVNVLQVFEHNLCCYYWVKYFYKCQLYLIMQLFSKSSLIFSIHLFCKLLPLKCKNLLM